MTTKVIIDSIGEIVDGMKFSLTHEIYNDPTLKAGVVYTFREHSIDKPFAVYQGNDFVKLLDKGQLRELFNNRHVGLPIGHESPVDKGYKFRIKEYVVTDSSDEVYTVVEDLYADGEGGWKVVGEGINDEDDRWVDNVELGEDETYADIIEQEIEQRADDDADYFRLASSEARQMAGMAHGNRGLADYSGLELDRPDGTGCYSCGGRGCSACDDDY